MQAWRSHRPGGPDTLVLEDIARPIPGKNEVLIEVKAVGLNFPDLLFLSDSYQIQAPRPLIPGSEISGVVTESRSTCFQPGDHIIARCGWGGMAEYISVSDTQCTTIPRDWPFEEAAAFVFTYATAYHALSDLAAAKPGASMLVLGASGGVGCAAIQVGKSMGLQVIAAASNQKKLDFAISAGADHGVVYEADGPAIDFQTSVKHALPDGVDIILDPIGGRYTERAMRCLATGGTFLVVGFADGIPSPPLNLVLLRSMRVLGVDWRTFTRRHPEKNRQNIEELMRLREHGYIRPQLSSVHRFEEAPGALAELQLRKVMGKSVVSLCRDGQ